MLSSAALLGLVAVIGTGILAGIHDLTAERITAQERRVILEQLNQVIPTGEYDNALHEDFIDINDQGVFRHEDPVRVYRARRGDEPVAVVFNLVAPDGYNGDIRLMVAIRFDGTISGTRVIRHKETPGLGDPIELKRSDWVLSFNDRSLQNPETSGWAVLRDGGIFDQFTGATITPRAVVKAVHRTLVYYSNNRDAIFAPHQAIDPMPEQDDEQQN
jgi:electron transport complex protein RnfG